ncbi:uncharacterized protein QC761_0028770 [Podospora bellae-mahoneyi]|uniref:Uncharacterized protein n=1 Tax=Podospora bellae-mahoneyi TaxID=2093777 RepID=A0ABR0FSE9_9PEZI|nr:hypothetical protein QC761_0028770 [Podospora bellae-mahoneyi]
MAIVGSPTQLGTTDEETWEACQTTCSVAAANSAFIKESNLNHENERGFAKMKSVHPKARAIGLNPTAPYEVRRGE